MILALVALFALPAAQAQAFGTAVSISITPSTLQLTADQTVALTVTAKDAANETQNVTGGSIFSTNDPRGSFTANTYEAGKAGNWTIAVAYQGLTVNTPVTVTSGALAEMSLVPDSQPEIVPLNRNVTFAAQGFDGDNNRISIPQLKWVTTGDIGTISSIGAFSPTKEGKGTVTATSGSVTHSIDLTVVAARDTSTITNPPAANLNANANTNTAVNGNVNSNANTNTSTNLNINTPDTTGTTDSERCTTRSNWLWGVTLLALLGGIAILYAFVPVAKTWPPIVGLGAAIILAIVERKYGCATNAWWPWIAILGSAGLTVFAYQQSPREKPQT